MTMQVRMMNEIAFNVPLAGKIRLHVWQRPRAGGQTSTVTVRPEGAADIKLTGGLTLDYLKHEVEVVGPARVSWDPTDSDVSVVYAFQPDRVAGDGILVCWTADRAAAETNRFHLHFKPPFGWMNDPNGMSFKGETFHLFYQHYPHAQRWGTMHWGHTTSTNLVDWCHQPVFLDPRRDLLADKTVSGGAYSGTAVPRADGRLTVYYTDHEDGRLPTMEWQIGTISDDWLAAGTSKTLVQDRPPLGNIGPDNRDPYVFLGPDGKWKMLLGGVDDIGGVVYLYESADPDGMDGWTYVSILHREQLRTPRPLECPCLVPLGASGSDRYLLVFGVLGMRELETRRRNLSFGVVGTFRDNMFTPIETFEMDFGTDAYGFQAIPSKDGPLTIAWAGNWVDYHRDRDYPTCMTFPRRIEYRDGTLLTPPIDAVAELRKATLFDGRVPEDMRFDLPDGMGEILIGDCGSTPLTIRFAHPTHDMSLTYDGETLELHFELPVNRVVPRYVRRVGALEDLRIFVDVGLIEIYANGGQHCATKRFDSDLPVTAIEVRSKTSRPRLTLYHLRPALQAPKALGIHARTEPSEG